MLATALAVGDEPAATPSVTIPTQSFPLDAGEVRVTLSKDES